MIVYALMAHLQNLTLPIWQCWSPRYNVSVLSTCGGYHPSGLIVASLIKTNNYHNNNNRPKQFILFPSA